MATLQISMHGPATCTSRRSNRKQTIKPLAAVTDGRHHRTYTPTVLIIAAYFLALASIAVIAIGGQFPWFTVAPATVLSLIAYFRHVEASLDSR